MQKQPVERLEQALVHWENSMVITDLMNYIAVAGTGVPLVPSGTMVQHWAELRNDILHLHDREFPVHRYRPNVGSLRELSTGMIAPFAHCFYAWNRYSRRVFHVTKPLQALLNGTELKDISWDGVHWPFESFFVTLDEPIIGSEGEEYDGILFARLGKTIYPEWPDGDPLQIMLFPRWFQNVLPINASERDEMRRHVRNRNKNKLQKCLDRVSRRCGFPRGAKCVMSSVSVTPSWLHMPISTSFAAMQDVTKQGNGVIVVKQPYFAEWDAAARIVLGLAFYLTTSGKSGPQIQRSPFQIRLKNDDPRAIRLEGEVAHVYAGDPPDEDEQEAFLSHRPRAPGEVCASFVMGYWKRPPGEGANPKAVKTVWVRPHLRRKDRLKPGEIPGGLRQEK